MFEIKGVLSVSVFYLITLLLSVLPDKTSAQSLPGPEWKLAKQGDSISIYTRKSDNSNLKMFKVFSNFNTSIEHMVAVLQDVDNFNKWTENLKHTQLLEKPDTNTLIIYSY